MSRIRKWVQLSSQFVLDNQWCRIRQDRVALPNGVILDDYFVHVRPEIVLILPKTPSGEVIFVRQYRHGVEKILLELPARTFNVENEDSLDAVMRELEEETGYISSEWIKLSTVYDNPVKDTNGIHLYLALNAQPTGKQSFDLSEEIEVVSIPINEIKHEILKGNIFVAGTISTLFLGLDL